MLLDEVKKQFIFHEESNPEHTKRLKTLVEDSLGVEGPAVAGVKEIIAGDVEGIDYPRIDLEFLRMRKKGWPRFAVYNLQDPISFLQTQLYREWNKKEKFYFSGNYQKAQDSYSRSPHGTQKIGTGIFDEYFEDIFEEFKKRCIKSHRWTRKFANSVLDIRFRIQTKFNALIPPRVRKEIKEARKTFTESIYMIGEAEEWTLSNEVKITPVRRVDPLVIGVKGRKAFLVTSFDLAPVEDMVRREFTEDMTDPGRQLPPLGQPGSRWPGPRKFHLS